VLRALGCLGFVATSGAIAQQGARQRRIGALIGWSQGGPAGQVPLATLKERLAALGWIESRNLRTDIRWSAADPHAASMFAKELLALNPEVILSVTTPATAALQRETKTIPIVFTAVSDPIGSGFVQSLAHPGGNITGFIDMESAVVSKGLQVLTEIAPQVKRMAVMFNPRSAPFAEYYLKTRCLKWPHQKGREYTFDLDTLCQLFQTCFVHTLAGICRGILQLFKRNHAVFTESNNLC